MTVKKKDLDVGSFTNELNKRSAEGWGLAHVFEQHGNPVPMWERQ